MVMVSLIMRSYEQVSDVALDMESMTGLLHLMGAHQAW